MANMITLDMVENSAHYDLNQLMNSYCDDFTLDSELSQMTLNDCKYYAPSDLTEHINQNSIASDMLSVFGINCRGLTTNFENLKHLISDLSTTEFQFDIIGLTEIHSIKSNFNYDLHGYQKFIKKERPKGDDGYGGVGMYIKIGMEYEERKDLSVFIPHVVETQFIEFKALNRTYICGAIYRPNTQPKADIDVALATIYELVDIIKQENKSVILLGDFNIDLLKFESNNKTDDLLNNLFSYGISPIITKPTRITEHSATLIDHIYTNMLNNVCQSGVIVTDLSDHFGTFAMIKNVKHKMQNKPSPIRSYKPDNIRQFRQLLQHYDFNFIQDCQNVDEAYDRFMTLYNEAFNTAFPLHIPTHNKKFNKREPWVTNGFLISSIHKQKLYVKKLNNPTNDNILRYKTYLRIYNKVRRQLKRVYYDNLITKYQHDSKRTWKIIRQLITKNKGISAIPSTFSVNGRLTRDNREIAEGFNSFFSNVAHNIINDLPKAATDSSEGHHRYLKNKNNNNFFMCPVNTEDVIESAKSLKSKLSSGHDNISNKIMKESIQDIATPLALIFNLSIMTGKVPRNMKISKIIPIFKSGDSKILNNYRPISLLPVFSKLLEKIVHKRLMHFLNINNILYKHQYGFREKHSTVHPIIQFLKFITDSNDKTSKDLTLSIFLDLKKAFDTVSHPILLDKLEYYGIRGLSLEWFKSYVHDRVQYTEINGEKSSLARVQYGVPQGSILGPLLFLIYINDLASATNLKVLSFADDTTLVKSSDNLSDSIPEINNELNKVYTWLNLNKMAINISKTCYMIFGPTKMTFPHNIDNIVNINNIPINRIGDNNNETSVKFLGIYLDEKLSWKNHINVTSKKINSGLFALNSLKNILPQNTLRTIYYSLIHCHITYCLEVWGNSTSINKIQLLQKCALRSIYKQPY